MFENNATREINLPSYTPSAWVLSIASLTRFSFSSFMTWTFLSSSNMNCFSVLDNLVSKFSFSFCRTCNLECMLTICFPGPRILILQIEKIKFRGFICINLQYCFDYYCMEYFLWWGNFFSLTLLKYECSHLNNSQYNSLQWLMTINLTQKKLPSLERLMLIPQVCRDVSISFSQVDTLVRSCRRRSLIQTIDSSPVTDWSRSISCFRLLTRNPFDFKFSYR